MTYKLTILGRLPTLNEYSNAERSNRFKAAKMKAEAEQIIKWYILKDLKGVQVKQKVFISYKWFMENKKLDPDNISFGKKMILDALVRSGVLEGDGWKQVAGFEDNFEVDKVNPRVEVEIREMEVMR